MAVGAIPQDPRLVGTDETSGAARKVNAAGEADRGRLLTGDRDATVLLGEVVERLDLIVELLSGLKS